MQINKCVLVFRICRMIVLLLCIAPAGIWCLEKKESWEQTRAANQKTGEISVLSWKIIGPFYPSRSDPAVYRYPPEENPDSSVVYLQKGKRLRWTQAKLQDEYLRINRRERGMFFAQADFEWTGKSNALLRVRTDDAEYLSINGKTVWKKGRHHGHIDTLIPVTLEKKNRLFVKTYGYDSFLRAAFCTEQGIQNQIELLLFLCTTFPHQSLHILSAAKEIRALLGIYRSSLRDTYTDTSLRRLRSAMEACLEKNTSADVLRYYLDFREKTDILPLDTRRIRSWINACEEQQHRGLLFKLARMNITSFANAKEGWQYLRELAATKEFYPEQSKVFTTFCNKNEFYREGADILLSSLDVLGPETRLTALFRAGILYRNAGDYKHALECFDRITASGGTDAPDSSSKHKSIKEVQKEIVAIFRNINKDSTCILPEAIGLKNFMEYIGKKAQKGDISKAAAELIEEIPKYRNTAIRLDKTKAIGGMRYIANECRLLPRAFQEKLYAVLGNSIANRIQLRGYGDRAELRLLMNGLPVTVKAFSKIRRVATTLFQRGEVDAALSWYKMLTDISPESSLLLSIAYGICLRNNLSALNRLKETLREQKKEQPVVFKGRKMNLNDAIKALSAEIPTLPKSNGGEHLLGQISWRQNLSADDFLLYRVGERSTRYVRPAFVPACMGTALYVYTGVMLTVYDVKTGHVLWSVPVSRGGVLSGTPVPVFRILVRGNVLYIRSPGHSFGLNAYDRTSGQMMWSASDIPGIKDLHIASDPVSCNGLIVFVGAKHHWWSRAITNTELFAVALDPQTGELLWKQLLVSGDSRYGDEYLSSQLPRPVETPNGIFIQTNRKLFHMLEPISGTIQWVRAYNRSRQQSYRYNLFVNSVFCYGDSVVSIPRDSSFIYCVNTRNGELRWSASRGRTPLLCGITNGAAVTLGQGIRMLDMKTGGERKSCRFNRATDFTLPVISRDMLWISGENRTAVMDMRSMKETTVVPKIMQHRTLPVGKRAVGFDRDLIYCLCEEKSTVSENEKRTTFMKRTGPNTLMLRKELKKTISNDPAPTQPVKPLQDVNPVLWWQRPVNMSGWSFPRERKNRILLWNKRCVCLAETDYFGTRLWEYSYDPNSFHVRSVRALGDRVLVQGSWKIVCLDLDTGLEVWTVQLPMPLNGIRSRKDTVYILMAESHYKQWQTGILDMTSGRIMVFASGNNRRVPIVWYHPDWMILRIGNGYSSVDILTGKTLWRYETDTRWYKFGTLVSAPDDKPSLLYMQHDDRFQLVDSRTGNEIFISKGWPFLPEAYSRNGKYYFYRKGHTQERVWDTEKQKMEIKWNMDIRELDWISSSNYGFMDHRIVVLNQNKDNYLDLYHIDPESGRKISRQHLFRVNGRSGSLKVVWRTPERELFLMSDRMLYCLRYSADRKTLADRNRARQEILTNGFWNFENDLSIKKAAVTLLGWHPMCGLDEKPLDVSGQKYWFPADRKTDLNRGQDSDCAIQLSCDESRGHLRVTAVVSDDRWTPFHGKSGDCLIFSTGKYSIRMGMNRHLQPVLSGMSRRYIQTYDCRIVADRRMEYTVELNADRRLFHTYYAPSDNKQKRVFSMSIMYRDDDGKGVRGSLVWPCLDQWGTGRCDVR